MRKPGTYAEGGCAHPRVAIIGVGNEFRSDDGLGVLVARELKRRMGGDFPVLEEDGEGASLMEAWKGWESVIVIDAFSSGNVPGIVHRVDAAQMPVSRGKFRCSSHAFGVAEAIEMARQLRQLPRVFLIYGIEGGSFEAGIGLSDPVVKSIPELMSSIEQELKAIGVREGFI